jgi:hypothetical protein
MTTRCGSTRASRSRGALYPRFIGDLIDAAERSDDTYERYGNSLAYRVSCSFEQNEERPLRGIEKHGVAARVTHNRSANVQQLGP